MSGTETSGERLHSFDFLRGIAILAVVGFHCAMAAPSGVPLVDVIFGSGKLGVQLFFLISALTMCHMWERRRDESNRTAKFYIRRFMRIAPLFWLAICLYLGVKGLERDGVTALDLGLTVLFLHGFWPHAINNVVPGGWSIAVEMTFYALFPLLITRFGEKRGVYLFAAMLLITAYQFFLRNWLNSSLAGAGIQENTVFEFLYFNFMNQAPVFLIGCYIHFALRSGIRRSETATIAAFAAYAWTFDQPFPLICIMLSTFVYLLLRCGIQLALLEKFGQNSYTIYLLHFIVIDSYTSLLPAEVGLANLLARFFAVAAICYGLSRLIHVTIERPMNHLTKRITDGLDRPGQSAGPAAA
jgi:exopolysaccharide production protein ExoZ